MLEAERNIQYIFQALCKAPRSADKSCGTHIPDTLHYQHGSLRSWYHKDDTTGEILKRDRRECSRERIMEVFCEGVPKGRPVAMYIHLCAPPWTSQPPAPTKDGLSGTLSSMRSVPGVGGQHKDIMQRASKHCSEFGDEAFPVSVDYFDHDRLEAFLATRENKHDVLLQRFVDGGAINDCFSTIEVCWSPYQLLATQRMSKVSVRELEVPLYTRCHTFDNDTLFNRPVKVVPRIRDLIQRECESVVGHIGEVDGRSVLRMVAYFAINSRNCPVLLWTPEIQYCMVDADERRKRIAALTLQNSMNASISRRISSETSVRRRSVLMREDPFVKLLSSPISEVGGDDSGDGTSPQRSPNKGGPSYAHSLKVDAAVAAQKMSFNHKRQLCLLAPPVVPSDVVLPEDWDVILNKQRQRRGTSTAVTKSPAKEGDGQPKGIPSRLRSLKGTPKIGRRNVGYEGVAGANSGLGGGSDGRGSRLQDLAPTQIAAAVLGAHTVNEQLNLLDETYTASRAARNPTSHIDKVGRSDEDGGDMDSTCGQQSTLCSTARNFIWGGSPNTRTVSESFNSLPPAHGIQLRSSVLSRPSTAAHGPLREYPPQAAHSVAGSSSVAGTSNLVSPTDAVPTHEATLTKQKRHIAAAEQRKRDRLNTAKRFYTPTPQKSQGIFAVKGLPRPRPNSSAGNASPLHAQPSSLTQTSSDAKHHTLPTRSLSHEAIAMSASKTFSVDDSDEQLSAVGANDMLRSTQILPQGELTPTKWMQGKERVYSRGGGGGYFVRASKGRPPKATTPEPHSSTHLPAPLVDSGTSSPHSPTSRGSAFQSSVTQRGSTAESNKATTSVSRQQALGMFDEVRVGRLGAAPSHRQTATPKPAVIVALEGDPDEANQELPPTPTLLPTVLKDRRRLSSVSATTVPAEPPVSVNWNLVLRHAIHTRHLMTSSPITSANPPATLLASLKVSPLDHPMVAAHCRAIDDAFASSWATTVRDAPVLWDVAVFSPMDALTDSLQVVECSIPPTLEGPPKMLAPVGRSHALISTRHRAAGPGHAIREQSRYQVNLLDLFDPQLVRDRYESVLGAHEGYLHTLDTLAVDLETMFYNAARGAEGGDFVSCGNVPLTVPLLRRSAANQEGDGGLYEGLLMLPAALVPTVLSALTLLLPSRSAAAYEASKAVARFTEAVSECARDECGSHEAETDAGTTGDATKDSTKTIRFEMQQVVGLRCTHELLMNTAATSVLFRAACLGPMSDDAAVSIPSSELDDVAPLTVMCESTHHLEACLKKLQHVRSLVVSSMFQAEKEFLGQLVHLCDDFVQNLTALRATRRARSKRLEQEAQRTAALAVIHQGDPKRAGIDSLAVAKKQKTSILGSQSKSASAIPDVLPPDVLEELGMPRLALFAPSARFVEAPFAEELHKKAMQVVEFVSKVEAKQRIQARRGTNRSMASITDIEAARFASSAKSDRQPSTTARPEDSTTSDNLLVRLQVDKPHLAANVVPFVQSILNSRVEEIENWVRKSETLNMYWPPTIRLYK